MGKPEIQNDVRIIKKCARVTYSRLFRSQRERLHDLESPGAASVLSHPQYKAVFPHVEVKFFVFQSVQLS